MQRHQVHLVAAFLRLDFHDQRDVFEIALQVVEMLHGAHEFLQVLELARRVGGFVVLPHLRIAALVEDDLCKFRMRHAGHQRAPALDHLDKARQRAARRGLQLFRGDDLSRGAHQRDAARMGELMDRLQGDVAEARASAC